MSYSWPILSTVTFLPLLGALLIGILRGDDESARGEGASSESRAGGAFSRSSHLAPRINLKRPSGGRGRGRGCSLWQKT